MSAISYEGHPGKLLAIIRDNLERQGDAGQDEQAERCRAHCDFIRTAGEVTGDLVGRIRARHNWIPCTTPTTCR